ncbi:PREDICTED: mitochondrial phosphate carrier protein 1, mitochondrial-like [Camelina sativa]|uniref:Mitochondrial phosphate carrier protein 1, mitochondrial-like n=1 Tax=Camelina sativa TaxID=90675 RepID=A0ABM0Y7N9_CAMSA|nr:PREDICTED: mitochondrial phosphate carrier protein 1, mitochondrial-like [Camelina sativa]XP_010496834.1 PREDICTED: mitochondrial phosphate carrier protein 1, mitochondrial-like [Camelina sativa]
MVCDFCVQIDILKRLQREAFSDLMKLRDPSSVAGTIISNLADVVLSSLYNNKAKNVLQAVRNIGFVTLFTRILPVRTLQDTSIGNCFHFCVFTR